MDHTSENANLAHQKLAEGRGNYDTEAFIVQVHCLALKNFNLKKKKGNEYGGIRLKSLE